MKFEVREGQGALFVNDRKEGDQPDYRGNARIGGVLYCLRAGAVSPTAASDGYPSLSTRTSAPRSRRRRARQPSQGSPSAPSSTMPSRFER